jgi:hypothetical protein
MNRPGRVRAVAARTFLYINLTRRKGDIFTSNEILGEMGLGSRQFKAVSTALGRLPKTGSVHVFAKHGRKQTYQFVKPIPASFISNRTVQAVAAALAEPAPSISEPAVELDLPLFQPPAEGVAHWISQIYQCLEKLEQAVTVRPAPTLATIATDDLMAEIKRRMA